MIENVRLALDNLLSNKLRAALTMLGITIGTAAVIVLVSVGQAVERFVLGQFSDFGTNLVVVFGAQGQRGAFAPLTQRELNALRDPFQITQALSVVPVLDVSGGASVVQFEGRETRPNVQGITADYTEVDPRRPVLGRYITQDDVATSARVAVLGASTVDKLFPPGVFPVGQTVRIGGIGFQVVGVLDRGGGGGFVDTDDRVLVPLTTAQTRLGGQRLLSGDLPVSQIILRARDQDAVRPLVQEVTQMMREERSIIFGGKDDFTITTQDDLLSSLQTVLSLLTLFLAVIAGISLLVGGIGIMNIMLVTVTERTREIGIRKALGAQNRDILFQFVTEAMSLSVLGGAIGIMIAALGGWLVSQANIGLDVTVQPSSVLLATSISTLVGLFFGYYPAQRAAALSPMTALRYE